MYEEELEGLLSRFCCYSFVVCEICSYQGAEPTHKKKLKKQIPLPTLMPCTKLCFIRYNISTNGILWAWRWSDTAHLQYQPSYTMRKSTFTKFHQVVSIRTDEGTCGPADRHPEFNFSRYLFRLVSGVTNNH